jgi:hypothetical protein
LFFWLLDITLINIFLIVQQHVGGPKGSLYTTQREFQNVLIWGLIEEGFAALKAECKEVQGARDMAREEEVNTAVLAEEYYNSGQADIDMESTLPESNTGRAKAPFQKGYKPMGNSFASQKRGLWSKHKTLSACHFDRANHDLKKAKKLSPCNYCHWLKQQAAQFPGSVEANQFLESLNCPKVKPRRSTFVCSHCTIAGETVTLCKDICFRLWHEHQVTNH